MRRERATQIGETWRAPLNARRPGRARTGRGRGKPSGGSSPIALARGLLGAVGKGKPSKGSRKRPALLAVVAGLGAAGAAALRRRRSGQEEPPGHVPPPEPVGEAPLATEGTRRPGAA
jgi:hypothetical protein